MNHAQVLEIALGASERGEHDAFMQQASEDPALLLELAATTAFFAQCRELRTTTGARYDALLKQIVQRAMLAKPRHQPLLRRPWVVVLTAAALAFVSLLLVDALRSRSHTDEHALAQAGAGPSALLELALPVLREERSEPALEPWLPTAAEPTAADLAGWLAPRNAFARMLAVHEARVALNSTLTERASPGVMPGAEMAIQTTADALTKLVQQRLRAEPFAPALTSEEGALALRALVAAGLYGARRDLAQVLAPRLLQHFASAAADVQPQMLAAVVEYCGVQIEHAPEPVAALRAASEKWLAAFATPQTAPLLHPRTEPAVLAEGVRLAGLLPGFGLDAARCRSVQQQLLASLHARQQQAAPQPELLAALLYCGDAIAPAERFACERQLRRWQPIHLAPDFRTLQNWAWGLGVSELGASRLQQQLRPLLTTKVLAEVRLQAGWLLCVAALAGPHPAQALASLRG